MEQAEARQMARELNEKYRSMVPWIADTMGSRSRPAGEPEHPDVWGVSQGPGTLWTNSDELRRHLGSS